MWGTYKAIQIILIQQIKVFGQRLENFMYILSGLSWCLYVVRKLLLSGELKGLLVRYLPLLLHVREITDQVDYDIWTGMVSNLPQPLILDIFETCTIGYIEDEEYSVTTLIKVSGDRSETLLTCSVPYLELYVRIISYYHAKVSKLHSNCHSMLFFKSLLRQTFQYASFTHSSIAQDHYLEQHVEMVHHPTEVRLVLNGNSGW